MLNSLHGFGELMLFDSGFRIPDSRVQSPDSVFWFPVPDSVFQDLGLPLAVPIQYTISVNSPMKYTVVIVIAGTKSEEVLQEVIINKNACCTIICLNYSTCNLFCVAR